MKETVESRAVKIAAACLVAANCCGADDASKCRKLHKNEFVCRACIRRWLLAKARKELGKE